MRASRRMCALALVISSALLAACSSAAHQGSLVPETAHKTTTHSRHYPASHTTTRPSTTAPTLPPPSSSLPPSPTSGPLTTSASVVVPTMPEQMAATEAPDGSVFMVPLTLAVTGAGPQIVWVVDGDGPAAVAEHLPGGANALAADTTNLYVANYLNVTAFNRATGNQSGKWSLPLTNPANTSNDNLEAMAASNGNVLVSLAQGNVVSVYRINPASTAAPQLVAQGSSAAFGPDGSVYYVRPDDHLVAQSASGQVTVGPLLADHPTTGGGGVQYVDTVAGGVVWVDEPASQGLDAAYATYDATTLVPLGNFNSTVQQQIVGTAAGTLTLNGSGPCPQPAGATVTSLCVARLTPTGTTSDPLAVGSAYQLLGPDPVVLTINPANSAMVVQRLQ